MIEPAFDKKKFENKIGYSFCRPELLATALTHSSAANERTGRPIRDNERLEFLGDSVFDLIISRYLYERMTDVEEGRLTKLRALIVCERSLAERAKDLGFGDVIRLGRGEELSGGRGRPSILADAMEAIIGAIYMDGGLEMATDFVITTFGATIEKALSGELYRDFKTELQELLQEQKNPLIIYSVDKEEGPDHDKTFYVSVWDGDKKLGSGVGKTKKEAEQNAAKTALEGNSFVF